jgi:hypothetical protein
MIYERPMMLFGLLLLLGIIALVVWAVVCFTGPASPGGPATPGLARFSISATRGPRSTTKNTSGSGASSADPGQP